MVLVRRIQGRGANGVVEINGEALFLPGTDLSNWYRIFSGRVREAAAFEAPSNKRPRWAHYGPPLKRTMRASTTSRRLTKGGGFFYSAVGSTAPYSAYVDQGTGVHAGKSPWAAKILPPYRQGSATLYEHTWAPPSGRGRRVPPVMIKGQEGQFFFDKALLKAFRSVRLRSFQLPGEGVSGLVANTIKTTTPQFLGNTEWSFAFDVSLRQWRAWRDEAFYRDEAFIRRRNAPTEREQARSARLIASRAQAKERREQEARDRKKSRRANSAYRQREAERARKWREQNQKAKTTKKPTSEKNESRNLRNRLSKAVAREQNAFLKGHRGYTIAGKPTAFGFYYKDRYGNRGFKSWSGPTLDLFHELGFKPPA